MVRQLLLCAGVMLSMTAVASVNQNAKLDASISKVPMASVEHSLKNMGVAKMNDGTSTRATNGVGSYSKGVQWKRPAGHFWGLGIAPSTGGAYYYTPLLLRPWVEYEFENISTITTGSPSWEITNWSNEAEDYEVTTLNEKNATASYLRYEDADAPVLTYGNLRYPIMYEGKDEIAPFNITSPAGYSLEEVFGLPMPVSSHYYAPFTRDSQEYAFGYYTGATAYPDNENGYWFGTNNSGINAMATRFEKPDQPYLLNSVYFMYRQFTAVPNAIPLKAYVFKTENDAAIRTSSSGKEIEVLALGDLIATAEVSIEPSLTVPSGYSFAEFKFVETNPVTGAQNNISLEIEDDITVVVTGFDAQINGGGYISSMMSNDEFDEGYGNLGFLGSFVESEDGTFSYSMNALKNFFQSELPNTTLGVLADVSYPWLQSYLLNQPSSVKLANDGETTETTQGLQYDLLLMSTSMTEDFEITYDGEEECEWLSVVDVYDDMEENEDGDEEFTGITAVAFEAAPNPNDESRVCHVKITIPAASYEITFLQGSNAEDTAVEVIKVEGDAKYYDLAGRRVVNPEKGIYVKVSGNKAEKVVL